MTLMLFWERRESQFHHENMPSPCARLCVPPVITWVFFSSFHHFTMNGKIFISEQQYPVLYIMQFLFNGKMVDVEKIPLRGNFYGGVGGEGESNPVYFTCSTLQCAKRA